MSGHFTALCIKGLILDAGIYIFKLLKAFYVSTFLLLGVEP